MTGAAIGRKLLLELFNLGSETEGATVEAAGERGIEFGPQGSDLGREVEIGYFHEVKVKVRGESESEG
jgi:hypothetical protein